ncbi:YhcN/YlaJ family sporulation lipoprotein [Ornithinibacillus halophilus]|uniref:Sporulation lipoprotein YhcN/YlaJ (Spore_YhcN_YlaJ) n=1 Tax=Ornithinibacillus halophilus TaxID=930117 RepID=A0A1M5JNN4_9BACI|nr:YhcN/YlaJ family sporulation lipoprotein [Ornithinibacillus halophilus]SHG42138.1 Sporulation lipoprotein YhcN/YlaJ (Spore_YhcN_YlaJ) [Ornithinibacillus halophilus]
MKNILYSLIFVVIALSACSSNDGTMGEHEKIADQLDPTGDEGTLGDPEYNDSEAHTRLGFVNYTKDQFEQDPNKNRVVTMDRKEMADIISRIIIRHEAFDEIATLVTGEEVLIAYEKNDTLSDQEAADVARKSAMSVLPRFFEIYVSDNNTLIGDIQSLHNSTTTDDDYKNTLNRIIKEMDKEPPEDNENN